MVLAAHQPYFIPYLAYWQLIDVADRFLIGDDYAFIKQGWITRNRILLNRTPFLFGLEVKNKSSYRSINETDILPIKISSMLKTVGMAYRRAPFFEEGVQLLEAILTYPDLNLSCFLSNSIYKICDYLGITTPIGFTSHIPNDSTLRMEERIYDFCHVYGADVYVNAIGGQSLYHFEQFKKQGIKLRFINCHHPQYKQFGNAFVGQLSILDAIMFNSKDDLKTMLKQYSFIDG